MEIKENSTSNSNSCNNKITELVLEEIRASGLNTKLKSLCVKQLENPTIYLADIKQHSTMCINESGYLVDIRNIVFKLIAQQRLNITAAAGQKEPIDYIQKAQVSWDKCILKSVNSMCTELSFPLSRKRSHKDKTIFADVFNSLSISSTYNHEEKKLLRPIYSSSDFYDTIVAVKNPNRSKDSSQSLCSVDVALESSTKEELSSKFRCLIAEFKTCDMIDMPYPSSHQFNVTWKKLGDKVIASGCNVTAREYTKHGCPSGKRAVLWKIVLGIDNLTHSQQYINKLKNAVCDYDLLVDHLIIKDIRLTTSNDDSFFVFEDRLYEILLMFCRDTAIQSKLQSSTAQPPKSYVRGKLGVPEYSVIYPPSGVIPIHGFSLFASPLCFVFHDCYDLYYTFRELYTRFFFRLHNLSSHPQGIISLSILFESLLKQEEPNLFIHLCNTGIVPLKLVFGWLSFAFAGYLATDQVLYLWDRIIAYDSLEPIPMLACAILSFRRPNLMSVTSIADIEAILKDISTIEILPLLAAFFT